MYFTFSSFIQYTNISTIDESDESNFIRIRERQMLKVTKFIAVKSFVEALNNMVCELKITSGCKKNV